MNTLDRPILITGTPRSGKTLVAALIATAPEIHWFNEPLMIWDLGLGHRADDERRAEEATTDLRNKILTSCQSHLQASRKQRYLDDLSSHAIRLPFVFSIMPNARLIHLVRDPEDAIPEMLYGWTYRDSVIKAVARRWRGMKLQTLPQHLMRFFRNYISTRSTGKRHTWGPRVPNLAEYIANHSPALVAAYQWKCMIEKAWHDLDRISLDNWIEIRYADLIQNPDKEARRIALFCQLEDVDALVEHARGMITKNHHFEKKVFPSDVEWVEIQAMIDETRKRLDERHPAGQPTPSAGSSSTIT